MAEPKISGGGSFADEDDSASDPLQQDADGGGESDSAGGRERDRRREDEVPEAVSEDGTRLEAPESAGRGGPLDISQDTDGGDDAASRPQGTSEGDASTFTGGSGGGGDTRLQAPTDATSGAPVDAPGRSTSESTTSTQQPQDSQTTSTTTAEASQGTTQEPADIQAGAAKRQGLEDATVRTPAAVNESVQELEREVEAQAPWLDESDYDIIQQGDQLVVDYREGVFEERFAENVEQEYGIDLREGDVTRRDGGVELTETGEAKVIASQFNDDYPDIDIGPDDVTRTSEGGWKLTDTALDAVSNDVRSEQRAADAAALDKLVPAEITADDISVSQEYGSAAPGGQINLGEVMAGNRDFTQRRVRLESDTAQEIAATLGSFKGDVVVSQPWDQPTTTPAAGVDGPTLLQEPGTPVPGGVYGPDQLGESRRAQIGSQAAGAAQSYQQARRQAEREAAEQLDQQLDDEFGLDLERGADYTLEETDGGEITASLTQAGRQKLIDKQEQESEEVVAGEVERFFNSITFGLSDLTGVGGVSEEEAMAIAEDVVEFEPVSEQGQEELGDFTLFEVDGEQAEEVYARGAEEFNQGVGQAVGIATSPASFVVDEVLLNTGDGQGPTRKFIENVGAGGAGLVTSIPSVAKESAEFVGAAGSAGAEGDTSFFTEDIPNEAAEQLTTAGRSFAADPVAGGGRLVGSLAGSYGLLRGAQTFGGPRAARAASFAVQPGEELAITAARSGVISSRAASVVPGVRRGQIAGGGTSADVDTGSVGRQFESDVSGRIAETLRGVRERAPTVEARRDPDAGLVEFDAVARTQAARAARRVQAAPGEGVAVIRQGVRGAAERGREFPSELAGRIRSFTDRVQNEAVVAGLRGQAAAGRAATQAAGAPRLAVNRARTRYRQRPRARSLAEYGTSEVSGRLADRIQLAVNRYNAPNKQSPLPVSEGRYLVSEGVGRLREAAPSPSLLGDFGVRETGAELFVRGQNAARDINDITRFDASLPRPTLDFDVPAFGGDVRNFAARRRFEAEYYARLGGVRGQNFARDINDVTRFDSNFDISSLDFDTGDVRSRLGNFGARRRFEADYYARLAAVRGQNLARDVDDVTRFDTDGSSVLDTTFTIGGVRPRRRSFEFTEEDFADADVEIEFEGDSELPGLVEDAQSRSDFEPFEASQAEPGGLEVFSTSESNTGTGVSLARSESGSESAADPVGVGTDSMQRRPARSATEPDFGTIEESFAGGDIEPLAFDTFDSGMVGQPEYVGEGVSESTDVGQSELIENEFSELSLESTERGIESRGEFGTPRRFDFGEFSEIVPGETQTTDQVFEQETEEKLEVGMPGEPGRRELSTLGDRAGGNDDDEFGGVGSQTGFEFIDFVNPLSGGVLMTEREAGQ